MPFTFMTRPDGQRVREVRRAREWTQDELARRVGLSRQYLSDIENGQSVSKIAMRRVARALGVSFNDITLPRETADEPDQDEAQQEQVPDEPDEVAA